MVDNESGESVKKLAWYGILYGAIISVGAAFLAAGISAFITEISIIPNLFSGDQKAAVAINLLSSWFYFLLLAGGILIGLGLLGAWRIIFKSKK